MDKFKKVKKHTKNSVSIAVNGETLCLEGIITFCIQNALKITYEHMRFQKIFRGLYPRTPVSRGASSNSAGKGAYNAGMGEGGRGGGGKEGMEGRGIGEGQGNVMGLQPPQFLNSVHAPEKQSSMSLAIKFGI